MTKTEFPKWSDQGEKNGAGPFVIVITEFELEMWISGWFDGAPSRRKVATSAGSAEWLRAALLIQFEQEIRSWASCHRRS